MWDYVGIGVAVVSVAFALWVVRRIRYLERATRSDGGHTRSQRLDIHALKMGLLTREQLRDIHQEMPLDAGLWDRQALELERKGLGIDRESNPELH